MSKRSALTLAARGRGCTGGMRTERWYSRIAASRLHPLSSVPHTPRPTVTVSDELRRQFGDIDIYLFDQLQRGRIARASRILDAGCGGGRNLVYLIQQGFDVWGIDTSAEAIAAVRALSADLGSPLGAERFSVQPVERLALGNAAFDVVISSAVLHFARDEVHWWAMVTEMWRVLAPGGFLFARLASSIGHETRVRPVGGRRYVLPDGSERFLVDEDFLMNATDRLGGQLVDPLKTTVVQALRSMTTWVVRKSASA